MNYSSPLKVLSPSERNSRTPRSAAQESGSISISPATSVKHNDFKTSISHIDLENQVPETMDKPPNYTFEDFLSEDDNDLAYGVRESSPFLEIPNNAARSLRNTPRRPMSERNPPAALGETSVKNDGSTTPTAKASDVDFGMETIPEINSDFHSHTPINGPAQALGGSCPDQPFTNLDNVDVKLSESSPQQSDALDRSGVRPDFHASTDARDEEHGSAQAQEAQDDDLSSLSAFSAVPHAQVSNFEPRQSSAAKRSLDSSQSPKKKTKHSPESSPQTAVTPPRQHEVNTVFEATPTANRSSSDLMNFTPKGLSPDPASGRGGALRNDHQSEYTPISPNKDTMATHTPSKASLIDCDMSALSPRSIPTITPRELESMRSSFLSEIATLKATLDDRDAEVSNLTGALSDTEKRLGDALDELRGESTRREALETERAEWEGRSAEMEKELADLRCDLEEDAREKERMLSVIKEFEETKSNLELRLKGLEAKLASTKTHEDLDTGKESMENMVTKAHMEKEIQDQVQKKLSLENEKLKAANSSTTGGAVSLTAASDNTIRSENHTQELQERLDTLQKEFCSLKNEYDSLKNQLELERIEKGELVAAVDEWLALQQEETVSTPESKRPRSTRDEEEQNDPDSRQEQPQSKRRRSTPVSDEKERDRGEQRQPQSPQAQNQQRSVSRESNSSISHTDNRHRPVQAGPTIGKTPATSRIARFAPSDASANSSSGSAIARPRSLAGPAPRMSRFGLQASASVSSGLNNPKNSNNSGANSTSTSRISGPAPSGNAASSRSGIMGSIERMGMGMGAGSRARGGHQSHRANGN
ncbi:hypothetical protein AAP_03160 [Ascosphaera apis ARSEF 7405]|uniref:Uncharacterized protein n=1 Tax=Ascosphaera apis ARSEF 7405 TaxID=392613 RepID=A0A167YYZ5_9EURO|nr:hypothetical protein AAP_03160 [Ascosphaera apis ARSEF 7405]